MVVDLSEKQVFSFDTIRPVFTAPRVLTLREIQQFLDGKISDLQRLVDKDSFNTSGLKLEVASDLQTLKQQRIQIFEDAERRQAEPEIITPQQTGTSAKKDNTLRNALILGGLALLVL